jgi:hypothetical protein
LRITTIEELAAYLRTEAARIQAEQLAAAEGDADSPTKWQRVKHLEGELAAVQKTLVMVSDDSFADVQRERALTDSPLRSADSSEAGGGEPNPVAPVALTPPWPRADRAGVPDHGGDVGR